MTDKDPNEIVADILCDHFGDCMMIWERHLEQAEEILAALKYHEMVALVLEKDKEIENLKSDLELFMDLCDKKDEWLEVQRNQIAELKAEIQNEYDLSVYRSSLES